MSDDALTRIYRRLLDAFGPQRWWPGDTPFEIMVGAVLTQNTNWQNVERAIANLKAADALDPHVIATMPKRELAELIRPSGYFNVKADRLQSFVRWFVERTGNGHIEALRAVRAPKLRAELLAVHGVGEETADSILLYALNRTVFVVDAYTRRFLSRHALMPPKASYADIQCLFETRLPRSRKLYNEYHALIVRLGKDICRPKPRCDRCPLRRLLGEPVLR